jgi:hypothetical protein
MDFAYNLGSNSTPIIRKYQVGETFGFAGVIATVGGANTYGVKKATTTAAANALGLALEAVTTVTAKQTDGSDPSRRVSIIINPDAVFKARYSGAATDGTAITDYAETAGDTLALTVTASGLVSADEGSIVCSSGNNAGALRKNITGGSGSAVAGVAFPISIAVGDRFFTLPQSGGIDAQTMTFTTNLTEINQSVAVATNTAAYQVVEFQLPALNGDLLTQTYAMITASDHLFTSS